jgi:hypothetical protein
MEKNWLIRTKSNHILGPVSKEKVIELYNNGSIKAEDEICSGNGYWFYIRETELVERFLTGTEVQTFNPMSEAKDVLTSRSSQPSLYEDDITMVGGLDISGLDRPSSVGPYQDGPTESISLSDASDSEPKKKSRIIPSLKSSSGTRIIKTPQNQNWLKYLAVMIFVLVVIMIYKRQTIMHYFFNQEASLSLDVIDTAFAQEDIPGKKKSF